MQQGLTDGYVIFLHLISVLAPKYSVNGKIRKYTGKQIVSSGKIKMRDDYN